MRRSFTSTPPPSLTHAMMATAAHNVDNHVRGSPFLGAALVTNVAHKARGDTG